MAVTKLSSLKSDSLDSLFVIKIAPRTDDPSTRDDGSDLQKGDLYFNTDTNSFKGYDGSAWSSVSSKNMLKATDTDPDTRDDGSDLVEGDIYYNTDINSLKGYDGSAWVSIGLKSVLTPSDTDPDGRDDGSDLVEGDQYYNTDINRIKTYNGTDWDIIKGDVEGMCVHTNHITKDYTLVGTNNAVSAGDVTIDDGAEVTVEDDATWTIV